MCDILTIIWLITALAALAAGLVALWMARSTRKRIDEADRLLKERYERDHQ